VAPILMAMTPTTGHRDQSLDPPALEVRDMVVDYPGVRALDHVNFDVRPGEVHALMGENGAGKTTLIKAVTGLCRPIAGTIHVAGQIVHPRSPRDAEAAGISAVHQELDLVSTLNVAENICLGRQPTRFGLINGAATRRR